MSTIVDIRRLKVKNRVMCAIEPDFAKMSVNETVINTSNMASAALLCHLGCRAKGVKCYGSRGKKCTNCNDQQQNVDL